ncbi:hypothetical protein EHH44_05710 [Mycolicibacter terrae]|uniref:Uncharacterized protein n=1 Tax=Mycolicibacter terrae TaxID=1788 RepID=A0ACD2EQX0_9MYCO|nr:hypothetical protein [Mycolicibacter terrae]RRR47352.1 hypothetical protein EHH44_05710 [Mycolicibacter terrae]
MEHLAYRCATVAAAALAVGGLVAVLTPTTPSLPDVQIRDFALAGLPTGHVDPGAGIDVAENHYGPSSVSAADFDPQQINLGDVLYSRGEDDLGTGSEFNTGDLEHELSAILSAGGGLDPQTVLGAVPVVDLGAVTPSVGGAVGGSEQAVNSAVATTSTAIWALMTGLPALQQTFNAGVVAIEQELNNSLVAAQEAAAEKLFGDNPEVSDAVNWIFTLNNTVLAHNEAAFNSLFGIDYDPHSALLGNMDPGLAEADWSTLLQFSPDDFNEIVNAIQADNLWLLLGNIDWASLFAGLF